MKQRVQVLEDFPEVELVGRKLGPLESGEETLMRPWEASVLERHGIVEPTEEFKLVGLRKRILAEERSSNLESLPDNFYHGLSHWIENLRLEGRSDEIEKLKESVNTLLEIRVQKLARQAAFSSPIENLSFEEKFLANRLSDVISKWRRGLVRLFERSPKEEVFRE